MSFSRGAYSPDPAPAVEGRGKNQEAQATASPKGALGRVETGTIVQSVTAAVERYLAQRSATGSGGLAGAPVSSPALQEVVTGVVEQYLANRESPKSAPACGCGAKPAAKGTSVPAAGGAPARVEPPAPSVTIVDFVCEDDVRRAIALGKKIFIGPRTIVTPSARELAGPGEILVRAER